MYPAHNAHTARALYGAWFLSCRVEAIDYIISFCSSEIYTAKYRAQRTASRITEYYTFFLNNSQHSSLVYIINEMEYQLVQSICKWATAFLLYSFLTSQNVSGYYVMFSP